MFLYDFSFQGNLVHIKLFQRFILQAGMFSLPNTLIEQHGPVTVIHTHTIRTLHKGKHPASLYNLPIFQIRICKSTPFLCQRRTNQWVSHRHSCKKIQRHHPVFLFSSKGVQRTRRRQASWLPNSRVRSRTVRQAKIKKIPLPSRTCF